MAQQTARIVKDDAVMGGEPRIEGHRISVRQVADWVEKGDLSGKTVADRYNLDIADVYRALTYFHEHPGEMAEIRRRRREREKRARKRAAVTPEDFKRASSGEYDELE